jgi:hypothetical protein
MKKSVLSIAFAALAWCLISSGSASAQNAILAEMYGRGVHAYYAGFHDEATQYLSMAIDNGIQDPRAHYFRGIVAYSEGRIQEAEADWQLGAEMEASGRTNHAVGRSLARFQGPGRLRLEEIRQQARLTALAQAMERSKQRYGELGVQEPGAPAPPVAEAPAAAPPAPAVTPPPIPPDTENPFADDLAEGQPNVAADDALEGAMNDPFADEASPAAPAAPAAGSDPFGGDAGGADPFGGGGNDPFGGSDAGGNDPFGGGGGADPFGGADDPFGGN